MSEGVAIYKFQKGLRKVLREKHGECCPRCLQKRPTTQPSILLPQQRCRVDGYTDPRPELRDAQYQEAANAVPEVGE